MLLPTLLAAHLALAQAQPAPPPQAPQQSGVSLADREPVRKKHFNFLIGALELGVGVLAAYAGAIIGVVANFPHGGLDWPPDAADILLVAVLPAVFAAAGSWLVGLLDLSQRSIFGSLLSAALGAVVGEAGGLLAGYAIGAGAAPNDRGLTLIIAAFIAPAFAALGSVLFMELLKPGELVASASLLPVRDGRGIVGLVPAVALRW